MAASSPCGGQRSVEASTAASDGRGGFRACKTGMPGMPSGPEAASSWCERWRSSVQSTLRCKAVFMRFMSQTWRNADFIQIFPFCLSALLAIIEIDADWDACMLFALRASVVHARFRYNCFRLRFARIPPRFQSFDKHHDAKSKGPSS